MASARGIRAGRAYVELGVSDKLTAGLRNAQKRLKAFSAGVKTLGTNLIKVSAAVATPLVIGTTVFASFEQQMARVRALTGATGRAFDRLADEAKRLGETTVFSASQAAEAMSFFALAGFDVAEILEAIGPTLNLAAAGQLEIAQAADIAAKIMAGMGIEANRLGEAVDVLTKAMTTANTDLTMLGDAMKFVGPIAKSAGIAFEEIVAAIQLLSNAGIQGEMAGTTLRGALLSLTSPSEQARETLDKLGVRVLDAQGNVRSLADIISDLNRGMAGLGTGQRLDVLGKVFQARQAAGVAELLAQGAPKLREFTAALQDSGGVAQRIADVQLNTLRGTVTILKSALEGLGIAVGESLVAPLRVVAHVATRVVAATAQWVRANRSLVVLVAAAALGVGAMGVGLFALGIAGQVAAFAIGGLAVVVGGITAVFGAAATAIGAILSPIGLVAAAVAGLGLAVLTSSGVIGDAVAWVRGQFARLGGFVGKVVQGMADALAAGDVALAANVLWLTLKVAWHTGAAALLRVWSGVKRGLLVKFEEMRTGALAIAEALWHALKVGWLDVSTFARKVWEDFTAEAGLAWATIQNLGTKALNALKGQLDETFDVDAANLEADRQLVETEQGITADRHDAKGRLEAEHHQKLDAETNRHETRLRDIVANEDNALAALDAEGNERLQNARNELDAAKKQLEDALVNARQKGLDLGDEKTGARSVLDDLHDRLAGLGDAVASRVSISGTFNSTAIKGLAAGRGAAERTAQATEQTAKHTQQIARAVRFGGATFA